MFPSVAFGIFGRGYIVVYVHALEAYSSYTCFSAWRGLNKTFWRLTIGG